MVVSSLFVNLFQKDSEKEKNYCSDWCELNALSPCPCRRVVVVQSKFMFQMMHVRLIFSTSLNSSPSGCMRWLRFPEFHSNFNSIASKGSYL